MNQVEKLINELCPEGVEFKDINTLLEHKSVTTLTPPKKLTKNSLDSLKDSLTSQNK